MARYPQPSGDARGSLKWIQEFVNNRTADLDAAIHTASDGRIATPLSWHSPLAEDEFAEYRDQVFLDRLDIDLSSRPLADFWPRLGPQWDALGTTAAGEPVLVEAKANIREIVSPPSGASDRSLEQIRSSLRESAEFLGASSSCDWSGTFYQYANRLAHLYLLHEVNGIDSWLVFIYFIGDDDVSGPGSEAEFRAALTVLHGALGLRRHPLLRRCVDVFIDVEM